MTVHEAAKQLEVSPRLVYRLCQERQLGYTRVGGAIRIGEAGVPVVFSVRYASR